MNYSLFVRPSLLANLFALKKLRAPCRMAERSRDDVKAAFLWIEPADRLIRKSDGAARGSTPRRDYASIETPSLAVIARQTFDLTRASALIMFLRRPRLSMPKVRGSLSSSSVSDSSLCPSTLLSLKA